MTLLSAAEVEEEIMRLSALLEERTGDYAVACRVEAEREIEYQNKKGRLIVSALNSPALKSTEARAYTDLKVQDEWSDYRLAKAVAESHKQALLSLRAQLSALQTIARTIGDQT